MRISKPVVVCAGLALAGAGGLGLLSQAQQPANPPANPQPPQPPPQPSNPQPQPSNPQPQPSNPIPRPRDPSNPDRRPDPNQPDRRPDPNQPDQRQPAERNRARNPRPFAFQNPQLEAAFNQSATRLVRMEERIAQSNQEILRKVGEARRLEGARQNAALMDILQDLLKNQNDLQLYLVQARTAWTGDLESNDRQSDEPR